MNNKLYYIEYIPFQGHVFKVTKPAYLTDKHIMDKILFQLGAMLSHHSRVIVIRIDLHPAFLTENNKTFSDCLNRINQWIRREYRLTRIGYAWVREQETSDKQHYHLAWMLDHHKVKHSHHIMTKAGELWDYVTDGTHHKPPHCYHIVKRNTYDEEMANAIARLSYLAKDKGKGKIIQGVKNYSTSRIKQKVINHV